MKSERRHKLETNELADSLEHWVEAIQPYVRTIAGLLIALVVLAFAYAFVSRHAAAKAQEGWELYFQAFNVEPFTQSDQYTREKLDEVVDKYPGTPAAWWAKTVIADLNLNQGSDLLYHDRVVGREKLHSAVDGYETVLKEATTSAVLERATFGLAKARESLGELKEAGDAYSRLVKQWPHSALEETARRRAKDLERPETKEFYDWFDKQSPGKSLLGEPGKPGEKPAFDLDILDLPKTKPLFPDDRKSDDSKSDDSKSDDSRTA